MPLARDTAAASEPLAAHTKPVEEASASSLLRMQGIVKRYGATVALHGVDVDLRAGEIHALLGENGAGKSTLMHVLSGLTRADAGSIHVNGRHVEVGSPQAARALGIAMVHQHFTLVPAFTVAENLALDTLPASFAGGSAQGAVRGGRWFGGYRARAAAADALARASALGWPLDPDARVADLSVGAQQRVEIVKALATQAPWLIFDEPTAVLAEEEVGELFDVCRQLRRQGHGIFLITHKLAEILALADRVTVLRRGRRVASCPVAQTDAQQLAAWMIGADAPDVSVSMPDVSVSAPIIHAASAAAPAPSPIRPPEAGTRPAALEAVALTVLGDRGERALRGLSLTVQRGEIVGIGGVDGNGQTELAEALVGLRRLEAGTLRWEGRAFQAGTAPRVGYIPPDRRRAGLALSMTIEENLLFEAVREPAFQWGLPWGFPWGIRWSPFLRRRALRQLAADLIRQFDIRTPSAWLPASALSGGNQQKMVVARALRTQPDCLVAMNPTRGLDIGATRFVHAQLRQARARGAAIVLLSTDLDELAALADRGAILSGGTLTEYSIGGDATQIGLLLGGAGPGESVRGAVGRRPAQEGDAPERAPAPRPGDDPLTAPSIRPGDDAEPTP